MAFSQEGPPWIGSSSPGVLKPVAKYHDNPLFKSSPTDNVVGDFPLACEDSKENCADTRTDNSKTNSSAGKVVKMVKPSLTRKRVLGERNCFDQQDLSFGFEEPPKTIRALSFPSADFSSSSSSSSSEGNNSPMSSSLSPPSPSSRFAAPVATVSPTTTTLSNSCSDSSPEDSNYDPKANLRTPRPKFLRYRPDWRLEFLSSLELGQGETLASTFEPSLPQEENHSSGAEVTITADEERKDVSVSKELLNREEREANHEQVSDVKHEIVAEEKQEGIAAEVSVEDSSSFATTPTLKAVVWILLLGSVVALALVSAGLLLSTTADGGFLSDFTSIGFQSSNINLVNSPGEMEEEGWEWIPDYDIKENYRNQTTVLERFSTDSLELDALLLAIMYGGEEEIQDRYLQLMEREHVEFYNSEQFLDELHEDDDDFNEELLSSGKTDSEACPSSSDSSVTDSQDEEENSQDEAVTESEDAAEVYSRNSAVDASVDRGLPVIDAVKLHEDLENLKNLLPQFSGFLSSFQLTLLVTVLLSLPAFVYLHSSISGASTASKAAETVTVITNPSPKVLKPKVAEDLVITPELLKTSPYGSFTAYRRIVLNEGSKDERVTLTPVRRSSRIQSHSRSEQKTPPVCRRVLI